MADAANGESTTALLHQILSELKGLKQENQDLSSSIDEINGRVNILAGIKQVKAQGGVTSPPLRPTPVPTSRNDDVPKSATPAEDTKDLSEQYQSIPGSPDPNTLAASSRRASTTSKIILTSYPNQAGVDPCPMQWGHKDPAQRGPVVVSRHPSTIRRRNGALHGVALHGFT